MGVLVPAFQGAGELSLDAFIVCSTASKWGALTVLVSFGIVVELRLPGALKNPWLSRWTSGGDPGSMKGT